MNPLPPPPVAGKTEWERFDNAMRKVLVGATKAATEPKAKPQPRKKLR